MAWQRRRSIRLGLPLLATVLSLAIGEATYRKSGKYQTYPPPTSRRPDLYQPFDPYGYRLWPSRSTTYDYPRRNPRTVRLVSNRDGFRSSRELDEPDGRRRILVVGDSMVFGEGVEEFERFTNQLEAMEPDWRVDNLGMTGYGPDLMLRSLEVAGVKTKPAVVVFSMYTDDFQRVRPHYAGVGYEIPRFKLIDGRLVSVPYPTRAIWDRLRIVAAIDGTARAIQQESADRFAFALNAAILDRFLELGQLHSFRPIIMFLPGTDDTRTDQQRRFWLARYAGERAVAFVDLSDAIHSAADGGAFIPGNWHLNQMGHQIVAKELQRVLVGQPGRQAQTAGGGKSPEPARF